LGQQQVMAHLLVVLLVLLVLVVLVVLLLLLLLLLVHLLHLLVLVHLLLLTLLVQFVLLDRVHLLVKQRFDYFVHQIVPVLRGRTPSRKILHQQLRFQLLRRREIKARIGGSR